MKKSVTAEQELCSGLGQALPSVTQEILTFVIWVKGGAAARRPGLPDLRLLTPSFWGRLAEGEEKGKYS